MCTTTEHWLLPIMFHLAPSSLLRLVPAFRNCRLRFFTTPPTQEPSATDTKDGRLRLCFSTELWGFLQQTWVGVERLHAIGPSHKMAAVPDPLSTVPHKVEAGLTFWYEFILGFLRADVLVLRLAELRTINLASAGMWSCCCQYLFKNSLKAIIYLHSVTGSLKLKLQHPSALVSCAGIINITAFTVSPTLPPSSSRLLTRYLLFFCIFTTTL